MRAVREACYGETYFDPAEMPSVAQASACDRYQTLLSALARHYGQPVADLFERAWTSETLADCPTFGEWLVALPEQPVGQAFSLSTPAAETTAGEQPTSPQESAAVDATAEIRAFMQAARRMEDKGNLENALELYRQALELAQAAPSLRSLAREIELTVQDVEKRVAAQAPRPQPAIANKPSYGPSDGVWNTTLDGLVHGMALSHFESDVMLQSVLRSWVMDLQGTEGQTIRLRTLGNGIWLRMAAWTNTRWRYQRS
jgi:hypothetical protein